MTKKKRPPQARVLVQARAETMGISFMAEDFVRNTGADAVLISTGSSRRIELERFRGHKGILPITASLAEIRKAIAGYEWLVCIESCYDLLWLEAARKENVKVAGFPMWECSPPFFGECDKIVAVTTEEASRYPGSHLLRWPQDRSVFAPAAPQAPPRRLLHNRGNGGLGIRGLDRNATNDLLGASYALRGTGATLTVTSLEPFDLPLGVDPNMVASKPPPLDRRQLYADCDLLIHVRRIPGLDLPVREAPAIGLPCLVPDMPTYEGYPLRVPMRPSQEFDCPGGWKGTLFDPDPAAYAQILHGLASGLTPVPPFPAESLPPTWAKFKRRLTAEIGMEFDA